MPSPEATSQVSHADHETGLDIVVESLHKSFGGNHVLRGVDLDVRDGETFAIIGPSGCGKSVLLKHIMGLIMPDEGAVWVLGKRLDLLGRDEMLELRLRIGMVFQLSALLNSLNVRDNVALGLSERGGHSEEELTERAREKLALVDLAGIDERMPEELSGGMKKRVAVARTLAMEPDIILFDEPTTGLDPLMSDSVDDLILDLKKRVHCTSVVVTHDMISAFRVADRIGMFHEGRIIEVGSPEEIRDSKNPVVRRFMRRNITWRA